MELGDSAYSCNSAVYFRSVYLCKLRWSRMTVNLATRKMLVAAVTKLRSSSATLGRDTLMTNMYREHGEARRFYRAVVFLVRR